MILRRAMPPTEMQNIYSIFDQMIHLTRKNAILFFLALLIVSVFYSKFLLSVSMIALVAIGVFHINTTSRKFGLRPDIKHRLYLFVRSPIFASFSLLFLAYLISGVNSSDTAEWIWKVRTKGPFLFLPLAFFLMPPLSGKEYLGLRWFTVFMALFSFAIIFVSYMFNQEEMLALLYKGQPIPTPVHHIRYSLLLAISTIISLAFPST